MAKESSVPPQLLRGMKDILPSDQNYWFAIFDTVRRLSSNYSFERIETPILEATSLFTRTSSDSDMVSKEMYTFVDKGGDNVSIRPEMTASVVRAYNEHGMLNQPQPVKLWYFSPVLRHDRPQAGRYRQFWQFGFEVLGSDHPVIEAQIILLSRAIFTQLGIETNLQINSIGDKAARTAYGKALQAFLKTKKSELTDEQKVTLQKNPLRLLDSKEQNIKDMLTEAPQIIDYLDDASKQHFMQVLEYLDGAEVPYTLNPKLVRGLDYYNRTVFEFWAAGDETGAVSLGGGGRYDTLVEHLGGRPTPAAGFAAGIERIILTMREKEVQPPAPLHPEVFLSQLGEAARKKMLKLFEELQAEGIRVTEALTKDGLKQQLEIANRLGAHYTMIVGQKELMDDTILIRDMENGIQEVVDFKRAVEEMKKRVEKARAAGLKPVIGQVKMERFDRHSNHGGDEGLDGTVNLDDVE